MAAIRSCADGHALHSDSYVSSKSTRRARGGAAAFAAAAVLLGAQAAAQQEVAQPEASAVLEEIQVTGSRIERTGFTTPVPVTSLDREELRSFEPARGMAAQLNDLPQFFGQNTVAESGDRHFLGAAGHSNLNMRGMGANRTLVLLDGMRVVPSDRRSSVNPDYLPSALIRRVEVVTGGASAAYGADALAGVTNFILDRQFTGFEARLQAGVNHFGDGENWRAELVYGGPVTDRLHLIGSFEARYADEFQRGWLNPDEVHWHQDWGYVINPEWWAATPAQRTQRQEAGEFLPQRLTRPHVHAANVNTQGMITTAGFAFNRYTFTDDGADVRAYVPGDNATWVGVGNLNSSTGGPEYRYARRGTLNGPGQNETPQRTGFLGLDYELNDQIRLWGHGIWGRLESNSTGAAAGINHTGIWNLIIFDDNVFLPERVREAMVAENRPSITVNMSNFFNDAFGAQEENRNTLGMWSLTGGATMELAGGWTLRGAYQYGESSTENDARRWQRIDRTFLALDSVWANPQTGEILAPGAAGGTPMCRIQAIKRQFEAEGRDLEAELHAWSLANTNVPRQDGGVSEVGTLAPVDYPIAVDSVDGTIRDCVPLNLFGLDNASQPAVDYVYTPKLTEAKNTQHFFEVLLTGTLHEGFGAGAIETAVGATWREESVHRGVDPSFRALDALGPPFNVTLDAGTPDEIVVIRGFPSGFAGGTPNLHRFSTSVSYTGRFNVWELFNETIVPLYTSPGGERRVELNLAGRYADYSRAGGHWTYKGGLDFQVTSDLRLRGTYSRDFREASFEEMFDIRGGQFNATDPWRDDETYVAFLIQGGNPELEPEKADTTVLGFVYQPSFLPGLSFSADWYDVDQTGRIGALGGQRIVDECYQNNVLCDLITWNPDDTIARVRNVQINIDGARVRGWDLELGYRMQPDFFPGRSESLSFRALGGRLSERSNTPLGGDPSNLVGGTNYPEWTTTGTVSYNVGAVGVRLQQNWQSSTVRNINWVEGIHVDNNRVGSRSYTNLGLTYNFETGQGSWRTSFNVNNLFNRDPVVSGPVVVGDEIGRRYSVGLTYRHQ